MSEEVQTEQITREPSVKTKVKDPKRVQAGKTLSEKNKRAREALKREEEREKEERGKDEKDKGNDNESGKGWIPNMSSQNIFLTIGAIGLAAYALFTNYRDRIADLHIPTPTIVFNPPPQPRVIDNNVSQPVVKEEEKNSLKDELM